MSSPHSSSQNRPSSCGSDESERVRERERERADLTAESERERARADLTAEMPDALAALSVRVDAVGTASVAIRALPQSGRAGGAHAPPVKAPALAAAEAATRAWAAKAAEGWARAAKIAEGWALVSSFACGYVPIEVWRSPQGVHVVNVQVEGPLVNSYIVIPTECLSDNGLPHTLEHLVFLGSEDFPYKGSLCACACVRTASGRGAQQGRGGERVSHHTRVCACVNTTTHACACAHSGV